MNIVDICPVGALTSTDFRFKTRVWFLVNVPSTCTSCARNCSITVGTRWDKIQRLEARTNPDVNEWWICDYGRLNYKYVDAEDRLGQAQVKGRGTVAVDTALAKAQSLVSKFVVDQGGDGLFGLVSARLSNEEIYLAMRYLSEVVGTTHTDWKPRIEGEDDDLLIRADKNGNTKGAELIGVRGAGVGLDGFADAVKSGRIKAAVFFGEDVDDRPDALAALDDLELLIVMDYRLTETGKKAHVLIPGVTWAEKEGTVTNFEGFVSKLNQAIQPPAEARTDLALLLDLLHYAQPDAKLPRGAAGVFRALGEAVPAFSGMKYADLYTRSRRVAAGEPALAAEG
jgi:NADH-quinone oxidoreductase subunit G